MARSLLLFDIFVEPYYINRVMRQFSFQQLVFSSLLAFQRQIRMEHRRAIVFIITNLLF
jgi:hypothetical protein